MRLTQVPLVAQRPKIEASSSERTLSRRAFLIVGGVGTLAALGSKSLGPGYAHAHKPTLTILQWNNFVPAYDDWFQSYVKQWGDKHDTEVQIDNIGLAGLHNKAVEEVSSQNGHDLFLFLWPPALFEDYVIDHREIYEECTRQYGKPFDLAYKSTYNPKTKKFFGFSDSYVPDPLHFRRDLWATSPDSWDHILQGGREIKAKHSIPVGIGLASEIDSNIALRALLYSFGGAEQSAQSTPALKSKETLEAIKFVKALYEQTMTDEVYTWDASSNNRRMLAGRCSLVVNAISIMRAGEREHDKQKRAVADNIVLAKAAEGPKHRLGLGHVTNVYVIWKFAKNIKGAKKFIVDYIGNFPEVFRQSEYYYFPCFPQRIDATDFQKLQNDPKYHVLKDSLDWTTNIGYPGFANAAIDEIFGTWTLSTMFAKAASGQLSPQAALEEADREVKRIFKKWQDRGKV